MTPDPKKQTAARIKRTEKYAAKLQKMFSETVNELLELKLKFPAQGSGEMFSFDSDEKTRKEAEQILRRLHSASVMAVRQGIELEWEEANKACDAILQNRYMKRLLDSDEMIGWNARNGQAMRKFIQRSEAGMNLSERVWKPCLQLRDEMEVALSVSIGEGMDAGTISRRVRQYLNDPDLMFRRFRYAEKEPVLGKDGKPVLGKDGKPKMQTKTGEDGKPIWREKWKKRIADPERPGKYRFIDYDKDSYRDQWTGRGYYKSSAQNAMRVARTETNIAYRRADHERWSGLDFVLGQRIQLSKNHPCEDICDDLAGDYPKDFRFDGWHPQCFCFVTPILMSPDEVVKMVEAQAEGREYTPKEKPVEGYPAGFKSWVKENADKISSARERGTEPYFIRNNAEVVDSILNPKQEAAAPVEISKNMPQEFKVDGKYCKEYGATEFNKEFFDLLKEKPDLTIEFNDEGSYESNYGLSVKIANHTNLKNSPWFRQSLIYHEFGHTIGNQHRLINPFTCETDVTELSKLRASQIKRLKKKEKAIIIKTKREYDYKTETYREVRKCTEVEQMKAKTICQKLDAVYLKIFNKSDDDPIFARFGLARWDILEQIESVEDVLKSLIPSIGAGHSKSYFAKEVNRQHEYLAHCFENRFAGNRVFQLYLPDIYAEMIAFVNTIKAP